MTVPLYARCALLAFRLSLLQATSSLTGPCADSWREGRTFEYPELDGEIAALEAEVDAILAAQPVSLADAGSVVQMIAQLLADEALDTVGDDARRTAAVAKLAELGAGLPSLAATPGMAAAA